MAVDRPLHIVHVVCTRRHAGVENYVGLVSGELARRGHRVDVITCFPSSSFVPEGVEAIDVTDWRQAARVLRSLESIDVVNSHLTEADAAAVWGLRSRPTPIVSTRHFAKRRWSHEDGQGSALLRIHSSTRRLPPGPILRMLRHKIDERIDIELSIGEFVARHMGRCDRTIRSGVPIQEDVPSAADRSKKVVLLQRLEPEKSSQVALDAWEKSNARSLGWIFEIHGEGSETRILADEIRRRGLGDSVQLKGRCGDVPSLLRSTSLLVAPAENEPLGLVVLEAMSFGVPVLASASGGHLETIGRVDGASMFPEGDSSVCASLIDRLVLDQDERQRIADDQRAHQKAHLSLGSMIDELERLYTSIADGTR